MIGFIPPCLLLIYCCLDHHVFSFSPAKKKILLPSMWFFAGLNVHFKLSSFWLLIPPFSLVKSKKSKIGISSAEKVTFSPCSMRLHLEMWHMGTGIVGQSDWTPVGSWLALWFFWVLTREHMYIRCFKNKWWICPMSLLWWSNLDL